MSKVNKKFLVLDAYVIGKACEGCLSSEAWKAIDVLSRIQYVPHTIVLDFERNNEDNIIDEYKRQAITELTKRWVIKIQMGDNIIFRDRAPVTISVLTDPNDQKYFQVAINSPHKLIISEDSHFSNITNHPEVTKHGIRIWALDESLRQL